MPDQKNITAKKMRVLSIGSDRNLFVPGSAVRQRVAEQGSLAEELHVIVFSLASSGLKPEPLSDRVWLYPTNSSRKLSYVRDAARIGTQIARDRNFSPADSLVTVQDPFESGMAGARISRATGLRLHVQIHTDFLSPYFAFGFLNMLRVRIARRILPKASEIRVVSERIRRSLVRKCRIPEEKISVLPVFVDAEKIRRQHPSPLLDLHKKHPQFEFIALVLSRLEPEKNISLALNAFAIATRDPLQRPDAGLVVVGSGSEEPRLKAEAARLGLNGRIVFLPWTDDPQSFYKTADLLLVPSRYEGYGLTLAESALSGCVALTTDVGIAGDLLVDGKNALVCPASDEKGFAAKLQGFMMSGSVQKALRQGLAQLDLSSFPSREHYLEAYAKSWEATLG